MQGRNRFVPVTAHPPLAIRIDQSFVINGGSQRPTQLSVNVVGYHYGITQLDGTEILTFQWHPEDNSEFFQAPHLHIGSHLARPDVQIAPKDVHKYTSLPAR